MGETQNISLRDAAPEGRLDVMLHRLAEKFTREKIEPLANGIPLWTGGLGEVVEQVIKDNIPSRKFTALGVMRELGFMPPERTNRGKGRRK